MAIQDLFDNLFAYEATPDGEGRLLPSATFEVFAVDDLSYSSPLALSDPASGAAINQLRSTSVGALPQFAVQGAPPEVILKSGPFVTRVQSKLGAVFAAGLDPATVHSAIQAGEAAMAAEATASQAAVAAVAAAAEAQAVPTTSDDILESLIEDAESKTGQALSRTIADAQGLTLSVPPGMTSAQVQAILTAAPGGARVVFAPGIYDAPTNGWTLGNDGVHVDASRASFTQSVWARPVFDLVGRHGVSIDVGRAEFTGTRGGTGASYRGGAGYIAGTVVWGNGDDLEIRVRHSIDFPTAVTLSAWAGAGTYDRQGVSNAVVVDECEGYDFGVLWAWQKGSTFQVVYAHDDIDDSAGTNPTHAIYGSADPTHRDSGVTVREGRFENHLYGQPIAIKHSDQLTVAFQSANASRGLANFIDCHDLDVSGMRGTALLANGGSGAFVMQSQVAASRRPNVRNISIQLAPGVDERGFLAVADSGTFTGIEVESAHSSGVNAGVADINLRGPDNRMIAPRNRQLGTGARGIMVGGGPAGDRTRIEQPVVIGATVMVNVLSGSQDVVVDYDPAAQRVTSFISMTSGTGTETVSTRSRRPVALSTFGEDPALNLVVASGVPTVGAANSALQCRVRPTRDITVTGLRWWSATPSGNYDIGIFDDASNARLWSSGSIAWPAAGAVTEVVSGLVLRAGQTYRLAFAADNATGTLRGVQSPIGGLDLMLDGGTESTTVSSAFPLPSSLVAGSSGSTTRRPLIVILGT